MGIFADDAVLESYKNKQFLQVVNEAYFGRTPGITRCFNAFCDFRRKYVTSSAIGNAMRGIRHLDADHDKDLHRFCREMERQFGLDSFSFVIKNDLTVNMYTYPVLIGKRRLTGSPKDFIYVDKEGYHYKKDVGMNIIVCAYAAMLFDNKYTDEETFTIVLHEVGHNFQQFLHNDMFSLNLVYQVLYIYSFIINLMDGNISLQGLIAVEPIHKITGKFYNKLTNDETKNNLYSYFNFIKGILSVGNLSSYIAMVPMAPLIGISAGLGSIVSSLVTMPVSTYQYLGEQMADNFATYYGFGKSAITSELNMPSPFGPAVEMVQKIPIIGHLYTLMLLPGEILLNIGDCHPSTPTRIKSMMNSMKTDLNDPSLSPKLRAELKKEIEQTEKALDDYYTKASKIENPTLFRDLVDKTIYYNLEGGFKYKTHRSIFNLDKGVNDMTAKLRESVNYIADTKII